MTTIACLSNPASGTLTLVDRTSVPGTDRTGRLMLAASCTDAVHAIYPIDPGDRIDEATTQVVPTGLNAHCIAVDSAKWFAYRAVLGADHVMQLLFNPNEGTRAPNEPPFALTRA